MAGFASVLAFAAELKAVAPPCANAANPPPKLLLVEPNAGLGVGGALNVDWPNAG